MWTSWVASVALGLLVGERIPAGWSLEFAIPLAFLAMLVVNIRDRASLITAAVATLLAIGLRQLPYNLGFIAAIIGGTATSLIATMFISRTGRNTDE